MKLPSKHFEWKFIWEIKKKKKQKVKPQDASMDASVCIKRRSPVRLKAFREITSYS
jgi:hypothetical protein